MSPFKMSKIESSVRLVIDFNEAFNQHDVPGMLQLLSEDCTIESFEPPPDGATYEGKTQAAAYWSEFFTRLPDAQAEIEDIFGLGQRCIMHWRLTWQDADGHQSQMRGVDIYRMSDDRIVELLSYGKTLPAAR